MWKGEIVCPFFAMQVRTEFSLRNGYVFLNNLFLMFLYN